jgi:hypothetical protein
MYGVPVITTWNTRHMQRRFRTLAIATPTPFKPQS